jgi:hypothetical protein
MAACEERYMKVRLTACGVFRSALKKLDIYRRFPEIEIEYLQPFLHNYPLQLRDKLMDVISRANRNGQKVVCLYGNCFPDIDELLKERDATRIGCGHCYEMLLGSRSTQAHITRHCFLESYRSLHPEGIRPPRGVAPSGFRPLRNIRYCSHP